MSRHVVVIFLIAILLIVSISSAQLKIINNEKLPYSIPQKLFTSRFIVSDSSEDSKKEVISKGCKISYELEDSLVVNCPKDVSLKNARRERIFSAMLISEDKNNFIKPKDIYDAAAINVPQVHDLGFTGKNRIVAILDTGIDYNHQDLKSSYLGGYDFLENDDDPFYDADCEDIVCGHATHVAGIITSDGNDPISKGVAPDAGIIVGKVCGFVEEEGYTFFGCTEGAVLAGLQWASKGLDGIKNSGDEPDVISMSLGSPNTWINSNCDDDLVSREVNKVGRTIPVVVAAGNFPFGISSPGCAKNAIVVGAIGGGYPDWYNSIPFFSGRGFAMKNHGVVAPGVAVYSTFPDDSYISLSGTSMSVPYVSGMIALLKEKNPRLTVNGVKSAIFRSAVDLDQNAFISEDPRYEQGYGKIDALGAINKI